MKKLIALRGVPASGKSTWAKKVLENDPTYRRVNRDSIRFMTDGKYWNPDNERLVSDIMNAAIKSALKRGFNVIVDNTNLSAKYLKGLHKIAKEVGDVEVSEKYFEISLEEALKRDANRERKVGEKVLTDFYNKYINKNLKINDPIKYPKNKVGNKLIQNSTLPKAIMCDIDGTLANMDDKRGPYEWDKVNLDSVNKPVADVLLKYRSTGYEILILTARDGIAKDKTIKWLIDNNIQYDKLFIKPENDFRKDTINKREIFDKYIRDKYNVLFVMDDRDQVVELWREIGLTCFQVSQGSF